MKSKENKITLKKDDSEFSEEKTEQTTAEDFSEDDESGIFDFADDINEETEDNEEDNGEEQENDDGEDFDGADAPEDPDTADENDDEYTEDEEDIEETEEAEDTAKEKSEGFKNIKFSVIITVDGTADRLGKAISSVVTQKIGFVKCTEIIVVSNIRNSETDRISSVWGKKYPYNYRFEYFENGTSAGMKNSVLKQCRGKYISFLNCNEFYYPTVFGEIWSFMEHNHFSVEMAVVPVYAVGEENVIGSFSSIKASTRDVNLLREPTSFLQEINSAFFRASYITETQFNEDAGEEFMTEYAMKFQSEHPNFGYVCSNKALMKRFTASEAVTTNPITENEKNNRIIDTIERVFITDRTRPLADFEQEMIISAVFAIAKCYSRSDEDNADINAVFARLGNIVSKLDKKFIILYSKYCATTSAKALFLQLHGSSIAEEFRSRLYIDPSVLKINIKNFNFEDGCICFDILLYRYGCNIVPVAYDASNNAYRPFRSETISSSYDLSYGPCVIDRTNVFYFKIPLYKGLVINFALHDLDENRFYSQSSFQINPKSAFQLRDNNVKLFYKDLAVSFNGSRFYVSERPDYGTYNSKMQKYISKKFKKNTYLRLLTNEKKNYILINDRPEKAGDNGEALFKYICKHEPELAKFTYYAISKKSPDYRRLAEIGNVVEHGSLEHKRLYLNAKYVFTSHMALAFFCPFEAEERRLYADICSFKLIWIQHGIILHNVAASANKFNIIPDYVVTSTKAEFDSMSKPDYFFNHSELILTGLARFDERVNTPEKVITIAPTWRHDLSGKINASGWHETADGFEDSEYYRRYSEVLSDERLITMLRENGIRCDFVLHPGMTGYASSFKKFSNDCINIIPADKADFNSIFSNSSLLITDYSSVIFDFAYLKKPVIYYQFDRDSFFLANYKHGYFEYERDGFGDVVLTADEVINKIGYFINNGFTNEQKYIQRINNTFAYTDRNNCRRILKAVFDRDSQCDKTYIADSVPFEAITKQRFRFDEPEKIFNVFNYSVYDNTGRNNYCYKVITDKFVPFSTYRLNIINAQITDGTAKEFAVVLYDFNSKHHIYEAIVNPENQNDILIRFTTPENVDNLKLLIYAGIQAKTAGNKIMIGNLKMDRIAEYR